MPVEVGIVDSGLEPALSARLAADGQLLASAAFVVADHEKGGGAGVSLPGPPRPDPLGHGTRVAQLILEAAPAVRLVNAQVFAARQPVSAAVVAAGLSWCVAQGARVVNLSLGLRDDRPALRAACAAAVEAGALLVASAPARGGAVFPAAYPGVLAVSGDARCGPGEWSVIDSAGLVGACPGGPGGDSGAPGGASFAAARVAGLAAAFFFEFPQGTVADFRVALGAGAAYVGREHHARRGGEQPPRPIGVQDSRRAREGQALEMTA